MRIKPTNFWFAAALLGLLAVLLFILLHYNIPHGTVQSVEYDSKSVGGKRRMVVYLPPDYPRDAPYPVLYLLHGAGDNEAAWHLWGAVDTILDRLLATNQIVPLIAVMPNGQGRGSLFEGDLLDEVIPHVESHFAVRIDGQDRAIAGLSLGGGQALSIGLKHPDRFAWVGGFAPSLAGKVEGDVTDALERPPSGSDQRKLLWLSCGDSDQIKSVADSLHQTLVAKQIPHVWQVGSGEHEWSVWKDDLRRFAPLLFRASGPATPEVPWGHVQ